LVAFHVAIAGQTKSENQSESKMLRLLAPTLALDLRHRAVEPIHQLVLRPSQVPNEHNNDCDLPSPKKQARMKRVPAMCLCYLETLEEGCLLVPRKHGLNHVFFFLACQNRRFGRESVLAGGALQRKCLVAQGRTLARSGVAVARFRLCGR
jgi:hypothetical protein